MSDSPGIPARGRAADDVLAALAAMQAGDTDWRRGRVFSLVYHASDDHARLLERAHAMFAASNLINPVAFPSLRRMEAEIVAMTATLLHGGPGTVGTVTSGGTESLLVAVAAYRDRARAGGADVAVAELIVPATAHPAFDKAAHHFGIALRKVAVDADQRVDVAAVERALSPATIAIVGSAPQFPHGVIDPIVELGALAARHRVPLHVDACIGGFVLPWIERLGRALSPWDFRVPGVTSISADLHKYGYAGKGASTLLWRSMDDMRHQFFVAPDFPGGAYASPTLIGTRPGGPIAAAWAALHGLGEDGYLRLTAAALDAADRLRAGIAAIPELQLIGDQRAIIVAFAARPDGADLDAVADQLEIRGWTVDRLQHPTAIHLTVTATHAVIVDEYLDDLRAAVAAVTAAPAPPRDPVAALMYGMIGKVPRRGPVAPSLRFALEVMYAGGVDGDGRDSNGDDDRSDAVPHVACFPDREAAD